MAGRRSAEHASNILGALAASSRPLSAYDLLDRLRPTGVAAPLTVYRALDTLIASGKVHRVESLNAFVACRSGDHHHGPGTHAEAVLPRAVGFAICDRCGGVDEFVDAALFAPIDASLSRDGFTARTTAVEVRGSCAACNEANRAARAAESPDAG